MAIFSLGTSKVRVKTFYLNPRNTGLLPVLRPRHPCGLPLPERLRVAHLQDGERTGRAQLRQVPLQDGPGHQVLRPPPGRRNGKAGKLTARRIALLYF